MSDHLQQHRRVRSHYARNLDAIMDSPTDWFDDAYSWDYEAGIQLTPIERALWTDIRAEGLVVYPQWPIGPYFVDFGNPVWKVAIECDGERWHRDTLKDAERQRWIESRGWSVYRITGRDCMTDFEEVEDDDGNPSMRAGRARLFIRGVAERHPQLVRQPDPRRINPFDPATLAAASPL